MIILLEAGKDFEARGGSPVFDNIASLYSRALVATGTLPNPVAQIMYIPLGPWPAGNTEAETRWIRQLGEMMRRNALVGTDLFLVWVAPYGLLCSCLELCLPACHIFSRISERSANDKD